MLINASPDILQQVRGFDALQPARSLRDTAIRAIFLMDAQIDHTTGLLMLRENRNALQVWCHGLVRNDLTSGNPLFHVLEHYCGIDWHEVSLQDKGFRIPDAPGLHFVEMPLPWSEAEFETKLRGKSTSYHIHHPFHVMMAEGKLTPDQLRGWVANRFYYQISIPIKDAAILSNCNDREIRREWILRILDHDGFNLAGLHDAGCNEAWIRLGQAVGLSRDDVTSLRFLVPAARFAVDAYVNFARRQPWQEAVASSLTELFAPHIHQQRIDTWPTQYPWVEIERLNYFKQRLTQARRDVDHGLRFTLSHLSQTRALQEHALEILQFKLDVLWALADAIMLSQCEIVIVGSKQAQGELGACLEQ